MVSFAGDEFELDLYHPVGQLAADASGLFLWSRSGRFTKQIQDERRGLGCAEAQDQAPVSIDRKEMDSKYLKGAVLL